MRHTSEMTFGVCEVGVPRKGLNYETDPPDSPGMYFAVTTRVCMCIYATCAYIYTT